MHKHIITIIIFLLCLLVSRPAEARLTLGVVTGPDESAGKMTSAQANALASLLAEKLHEEIVVKELSDSATLINWLDRFAMLDLALLPTKDVKANPGRFLPIGSFDKQDRYNLVVRQGVNGDLPQRLASLVSETGHFSWQAVETTAAITKLSLEQSSPPFEQESASIVAVIASQVELQHVPPLTSGRAWAPQEENIYRDILPTDEPHTKKLVIGVFPDPGGLVRTSQRAGQLAEYLEQVLPVSVKVREFTRVEAFAEWFMRYRMVDLAVVSPGAAEAYLGRDYLPIAKFLRTDKPGLESAALVVMRRGQNEELQLPLQRALLDMVQTEDGQSLMAAFNISDVLGPESASAQPTIINHKPETAMKVEKQPLELAEETTSKLLPSPAEYAGPAKPGVPADFVVVLPELPEVVETETFLPILGRPDSVPTLPEPVVMPAGQAPPVLAVESPAAPPEYAQPVEPVIPPVVTAEELPELVQIAEPVAISPVAEVAADVLTLPEPVSIPVEPVLPAVVEAVKVPAVMTRQLQPQQPDVPPLPALPAIDSPIAQPELAAIVGPALKVPAAETVEIALPPVPEKPVTAATSPIKEAEVLPALDEISLVEVPAAPAVTQPVNIPPIQLPGEPVAIVAPPVFAEASIPEFAAPLEAEQSERTIVPPELESPGVTSAGAGFDSELSPLNESAKDVPQIISEEGLSFEDVAPSHGPSGESAVIVDEKVEAWSDEEFAAVLDEDMVASVVAQPDIPQELRPSRIPVVRPGRIVQRTTVVEDQLLLASIPEPRKNIIPPHPPNLLPEPEPEPGVIYVVPFVAVMVPDEVNARVFDQFVDTLNREGESIDLQFVILKEGLQRVSPEWLSIRKYMTGEIYAYVEDSGCCSTDLRSKARLTYHLPNQETPAFGFEFPFKNFFDHDRSSIDIERVRLADDIAATLSTELLKALQN